MSLNDLKSGETRELSVADKKLILEPIPFGRLKKLARLIFGSLEELGSWKSEEVMKRIPDLLDSRIEDFCKLAFDPAKHEFMTKEWIDDNVSFVMMKEILGGVIKVNGLQDFLGVKGVPKGTPPAPLETRQLQEVQ